MFGVFEDFWASSAVVGFGAPRAVFGFFVLGPMASFSVEQILLEIVRTVMYQHTRAKILEMLCDCFASD